MIFLLKDIQQTIAALKNRVFMPEGGTSGDTGDALTVVSKVRDQRSTPKHRYKL